MSNFVSKKLYLQRIFSGLIFCLACGILNLIIFLGHAIGPDFHANIASNLIIISGPFLAFSFLAFKALSENYSEKKVKKVAFLTSLLTIPAASAFGPITNLLK